jgi:hypothetical protein
MEIKNLTFPFIFLLLILLIVASSQKLSIYFNSFIFLSKKLNYDKANYMANSSFFKYFYKNKQIYEKISIELLYTIVLSSLTIFAYIGFILTGHKNFGYLNNYYGDQEEYLFVNIFINIIIALTIIHILAYIYWYTNEKSEDDKLETNETDLKTFIVDNLSYEYLYDYYKTTKKKDDYNKKDDYTINNFITNMDKESLSILFNDPVEVFKLCFTIHILSDEKQIYIKKAIIDKIKALEDIYSIKDEKTQTENITAIKDDFSITKGNSLKDIYIIANYNHNNDTVLPPLIFMVKNLYQNNKIIGDTEKQKNAKSKLTTIVDKIEKNDETIKNIIELHSSCLKKFSDTIKIYKVIYDKYSTYYMYSLLLTNFLILYAIFIFLYIILKFFNQSDSFPYSIYNFKSDFINYIIYILIIYLFISCPIIIFGFN